jgi:hypothetical protein
VTLTARIPTIPRPVEIVCEQGKARERAESLLQSGAIIAEALQLIADNAYISRQSGREVRCIRRFIYLNGKESLISALNLRSSGSFKQHSL